MSDLKQYLDQNRIRHGEELFEFLRIPSVSAQSDHKADVRRCAEWLHGAMTQVGLQARIMDTAGHPVVLGEWREAGPSAKTVLVYGHYDVQPAEPLELWDSPPFEPNVRAGRIYARGAVDDKGQLFLHLKAIEAHLRVRGRLPVNVVVLAEGEEEVGSDHLAPFVKLHADKLKCDAVVISDSAMFAPGMPSILSSLRGLAYFQIDVEGPKTDLHSGSYGGAVVNPATTLARMLATLHDDSGHIAIRGFYDRVRSVPDAEREMLNRGFEEAPFLRETGSPRGWGEKGFTTAERVSIRPTLDVNGMWSGYTGEGSKTVLPSFAAAKVSMRLVPDQDPAELFARFEAHLQQLAPGGVSARLRDHHSAKPFLTDPDHPMLQAARRALGRAWTKPPLMIREGGSIPVMSTFQETHGLPSILMGFGLDDDQVHAPNEKFSLSSFHGGTRSVAYLYEELAHRGDSA